MTDRHDAHRALLAPFRAVQYDWDGDAQRRALDALAQPGAVFRLAHPFGETTGALAFCDGPLAALRAAFPDVERRDWIVMAGRDEHGHDWVGCGGQFMGTFAAPFLEIPPTGHLAHMRFHEFYRFAGDRLAEYQALWDIPEVMMQAGAWPMAPSLGREICIPGPATCDGLATGRDRVEAERSCALVIEMLTYMTRHPEEPPEAMEMPRFWHETMNWYGPAGIGTARGIEGFRNWHQIPFLNAMPDRGKHAEAVTHHFFGDGPYCAVTGWPNMIQTVTHDGWLGLAPAGKRIEMRSLDFWRIENGRIRENWVMVDILDAMRQLGVDVFARLREFNKARHLAPLPFGRSAP